jgi:dTDP-glucose 4,6-dehydratase
MPNLRTPNNILVTGGCGFIGSAFIRFLFRQPEFTGKVINLDLLTYAANPENVAGCVDAARYELVRGDICDRELAEKICRDFTIDTMVHFAAESHVDRSILGPDVFIQTNIVGTHRLLEVVRALPNIHFHHVSTDEVYGSLGPTGHFTELTPYQPNSPYSASKAASDHLVRAYVHTYGIRATLSNCSNNYGPYHFPEKLIPLMLLNMLEDRPLPVYGTGSNVRDWLYVDDHAEAIWTIICKGRGGETYNVGGEAEWTNLELLYKLIEIVANLTARNADSLKKLITFVKDRPGHDLRYAIDCSKLKNELGWTQHHNIESGLRKTVQWYLDHPEWVSSVRSGAYRNWIEQNYAER